MTTRVGISHFELEIPVPAARIGLSHFELEIAPPKPSRIGLSHFELQVPSPAPRIGISHFELEIPGSNIPARSGVQTLSIGGWTDSDAFHLKDGVWVL